MVVLGLVFSVISARTRGVMVLKVLRRRDSVAQHILPAEISKKIEIGCHPDPVMYEDPKSAKILVLGDLVPEILSKNRFWAIFGPYLGFFQNPVKSDWL